MVPARESDDEHRTPFDLALGTNKCFEKRPGKLAAPLL
jgi:hypothetical protein